MSATAPAQGMPASAGMTVRVRFEPPSNHEACFTGQPLSRHPSESWGPLNHFSNGTGSGDASFRWHDGSCTDQISLSIGRLNACHGEYVWPHGEEAAKPPSKHEAVSSANPSPVTPAKAG